MNGGLGRENELDITRRQLLEYASDLNEAFRRERARARASAELYQETILVLVSLIEARDPYTSGHARRVAAVAVRLAAALGWGENRLEVVRLGALIHDVGKIGVPDAILSKPGALSTAEYEVMKLHPALGARALAGSSHLAAALPYVLYHHERWDGRGYPVGLAGAEIPEEGRLLAVVDAFDAMTSARPYRPALSSGQAADRVREGGGSQFDPEVAARFLELLGRGEVGRALAEVRAE